MTDMKEIRALAAKVGAKIRENSFGQVTVVTWRGRDYGLGCLSSLLCFAEKARAE